VNATEQQILSDGTMPCPVRGPESGLSCTKKIPNGWTADEGHGGGHFWISDRWSAILDGGHYDAKALISGLPADGHLPEECTPNCPKWRRRQP
jgi:hypothetical protein